MAQRSKKTTPQIVQSDCYDLVALLRDYREHLYRAREQRAQAQEQRWGLASERRSAGTAFSEEEETEPGDLPVPDLQAAKKMWRRLDKIGRPLLEAGAAWNMDEWITRNPRHKVLEPSGFFDDLTYAYE